jgi:uncharacterized protein YjbI with pentapeptide repeats
MRPIRRRCTSRIALLLSASSFLFSCCDKGDCACFIPQLRRECNMQFPRRLMEWLKAHREGIMLVSTVLILLFAIVGTAGVFYAGRSLQLQYRQYQEEHFNRQQGPISLAWHTLADANEKGIDIGQSNAILFLMKNTLWTGNVTLNGSQLDLEQSDPNERLSIELQRSTLCGTSLTVYITPNSSISLQNSLLRGSELIGRFTNAFAMGADFDHAIFSQVRIPKSKFVAANMNSAVIYGGSFEKADFQGADLRNLKTVRGTEGAGTDYDDTTTYLGWLYTAPDNEDYPPIFGSASADYFRQERLSEDAVRLVDFRGARFLNADIRGADLSNSTITQSQVDEAAPIELPNYQPGLWYKRFVSLKLGLKTIEM